MIVRLLLLACVAMLALPLFAADGCEGGVCPIDLGDEESTDAVEPVTEVFEPEGSDKDLQPVKLEGANKMNSTEVDKTVTEEAQSMDLWALIASDNPGKALDIVDKVKPGEDYNPARTRTTLEKNWPVAVIETKYGNIYLGLYEDEAPNTVASFVYLISNKYYNGLTFHRVVPNFVIQGGDPKGTGSGGPGYEFGLEISDKWKHETGVLSMARTSDPNSNGSQFFLTHCPTPHLDGNYTAFGWVLQGQKVVDSIKQGDKMLSVKVLCKRGHDYIPKPYSGKLPY
ncbi:MAG: peptidylprolyl isomerase [Candidatus Wallbacteria bacterium]|nr:peptidylprolyl isomerase [Candidatus Wallbacteria bacterium]